MIGEDTIEKVQRMQDELVRFSTGNGFEGDDQAYRALRSDPGGHLKFPHPWPGQNPPRDSGEMPG
jgi:hypothetical protein